MCVVHHQAAIGHIAAVTVETLDIEYMFHHVEDNRDIVSEKEYLKAIS